jgi:uncharacterized membrane protein YhhN
VLPYATVTIVALVLLLLAEARDWRPGVWLFKPLAAAGFIAAALAAGALSSIHGSYGLWVLLALVLCFGGDVLLIPRDRPPVFRAGILSFLLGHLVFCVAFLVRGIDAAVLALACLPVAATAFFVLRWLRPRLSADFRSPVQAYVVVISAMVALAVGSWAAVGDARIAVGAVMFFVSDLAVARQRFVTRSIWNARWGLPLYFGGQLVLAATVGG